MKILSIEFIFGANENAEDLEDEDDRFSDRRIKIKYRDRYDIDCWTEIAPIQTSRICDGWQQQGGTTNSPLGDIGDFTPVIPWLHGGELNA